MTTDDNIRRRRDLRSASGFTLVELLVTLLIFAAIMAAVVPIIVTAVRSEPRTSKRAYDIQRGRAALERIIRDLRSGYRIDTALSTQLAVNTYTRKVTCGSDAILAPDQPATACRVTYSCSDAQTLTRSENPVTGSGGSSAILVRGLSCTNVFFNRDGSPLGSTASPDYVHIRLMFPAQDGNEEITLEDGVDFRNITPGV